MRPPQNRTWLSNPVTDISFTATDRPVQIRDSESSSRAEACYDHCIQLGSVVVVYCQPRKEQTLRLFLTPVNRSDSAGGNASDTVARFSSGTPTSSTGSTSSGTTAVASSPASIPATQNQASQSTGLGKDMVSVVGITCAIAGAVFTMFIYRLCILYHRRRRTTNESTWASAGYIRNRGGLETLVDTATEMSCFPAPTPSEKHTSSTHHVRAIDFRPPASDQDLASNFSRLREAIQDHVQWYCTSNPIPPDTIKPSTTHHEGNSLSTLLGLSSPFDASALETLLRNSATRFNALRCLLACTITTSLSPEPPEGRLLFFFLLFSSSSSSSHPPRES